MIRFGRIAASMGLAGVVTASGANAMPTNVILFIADGMGFEAVEAARMFDNGDTAPLFFETLTYTGAMTHDNAAEATTDSAASATAMATGVKVANGTISVRQPGDGSELPTVLERFAGEGKRTGLVTRGTSITDATPAAFGAHTTSRSNHVDIANDYLNQTRPNVLFGRSQSTLLSGAAAAGYDVATTPAQFAALDPASGTHYAGLFATAQQPALADLTTTALNVLSNDPDGFFLMVEHEEPDSGGHANDLGRVITGVLEFNDAVQAAVDWATSKGVLDDTLMIVTADHETGGLDVTTNNGVGVIPGHTYAITQHTSTPVPVYAIGPAADASRVMGTIDNTDIYSILTSTTPEEPASTAVSFRQGVDGYAGTVDTFVAQNDPDTANGTFASISVDADDPPGTGDDTHGLIRFDDLFGTDNGQVGLDREILSAELVLQVTNAGNSLTLHRMLVPWDADATWNALTDGVSADGAEAQTLADAATGPASVGTLTLDVTEALLAWQANPTDNLGWALLPTGTDGVDMLSSESLLAPQLLIRLAEIAGDYNGSGQVEQGDLDLVLQNWGVDTGVAGVPAGWVNDLPSGQIEQTELDGVLQNWGSTSSPNVINSNVPEPAAAGVLLAVCVYVGRVGSRLTDDRRDK